MAIQEKEKSFFSFSLFSMDPEIAVAAIEPESEGSFKEAKGF